MKKGGYRKLKLELIYSAFVMVLVPATLVINTVLLTNAMQSNLDTELRRKADLINTVFGESLKASIQSKDYAAVTRAVDSIAVSRPDLSNIEVVVKDGNEWRLVASSVEGRENFNT